MLLLVRNKKKKKSARCPRGLTGRMKTRGGEPTIYLSENCRELFEENPLIVSILLVRSDCGEGVSLKKVARGKN